MQRVKQLHVTGNRIGDHGFHQMIAWDDGRVNLRQRSLRRSSRLPTAVPIGKIRMCAQMRMSVPQGQSSETQRKICTNIGHDFEQTINQRTRLLVWCQTDLTGKNCCIFSVEYVAKALHNFGKAGDAGVAILCEGQQSRGQLSHIPSGQIWLIAIGIAALPINGAEGLHRHKIIHESTGAIINCDPSHMAVVCVHHPVNKAHAHPLRDEARLRGHGCAQKLLDRLCRAIVARPGLL